MEIRGKRPLMASMPSKYGLLHLFGEHHVVVVADDHEAAAGDGGRLQRQLVAEGGEQVVADDVAVGIVQCDGDGRGGGAGGDGDGVAFGTAVDGDFGVALAGLSLSSHYQFVLLCIGKLRN